MEHWTTFWPTMLATLMGVLAAACLSASAYWIRWRHKRAAMRQEAIRIEELLVESVEQNARNAGKWAARAKAAADGGIKVIPSPIDAYRTATWDTVRYRYAAIAENLERVSLFASFFELVGKAQQASQVERDVYVTSWSGDPLTVGKGVYRVAGHARLGTLGLAGAILLSAAALLLDLGREPPEAEVHASAPEEHAPLVSVEDLEDLGKRAVPTPDDVQAL